MHWNACGKARSWRADPGRATSPPDAALHHQLLRFHARFIATDLAPGDEELLPLSEPIDGRLGRLTLLRFQKSEIGDLESRQVADAFAQHQLAVDVDASIDRVAIKLARDTGGLRLKLLVVFGCPPVTQGPLRVAPAADLVPDHHTSRARVHRIGILDAERRRLQNSRGKTISFISG